MGRKLTPREIDNRVIEKIVKKIKTVEKIYGINNTRRACFRYSQRRGNEIRLQKEIRKAEAELEELKKKHKK